MFNSVGHAAVGPKEKLYVDDVFSTYLYTGNGSTQDINNGIALGPISGFSSTTITSISDPSINNDTRSVITSSSSGYYCIFRTNTATTRILKYNSDHTLSFSVETADNLSHITSLEISNELWVAFYIGGNLEVGKFNSVGVYTKQYVNTLSVNDYPVGCFDTSANLYLSLKKSDTNDVYLYKLNSTGTTQWTNGLDHSTYSAELVKQVTDGTYTYLAHDQGIGPGNRCAVILKITNSTGAASVIFAVKVGGTSTTYAKDLGLYGGNLYLIFQDTSAGNSNPIVSKMTTSGSVTYTKYYSDGSLLLPTNGITFDSNYMYILNTRQSSSGESILTRFALDGSTATNYHFIHSKGIGQSGNELKLGRVYYTGSEFVIIGKIKDLANSTSYATKIVLNSTVSNNIGGATSTYKLRSSSGGYSSNTINDHTTTGSTPGYTISNIASALNTTTSTTTFVGFSLSELNDSCEVGKGGMVWGKSRSVARSHWLQDTARGNYYSISDLTDSQYSSPNSTNSNGFTLGSSGFPWNNNNESYVSWTFRKAPKFFDVVTYTGNGTASRAIAHSLGQAPGMIIVKQTDGVRNWPVYHRSVSTGTGYLNTTAAFVTGTGNGVWGDSSYNNIAPTSSVFYVGSDSEVNGNGLSYVAYILAHDTTADGIIQCGSYTGNGSAAGPTVTLGWEPQFILTKRTDSATGGWWSMVDSMRGLTVGSNDMTLWPNANNAEDTGTNAFSPTSTGFQVVASGASYNETGGTYIYLAIRRPNKPPTSGTQVYNAIARTGTGAAATVTGVGFSPDLVISHYRNVGVEPHWFDRLRGPLIRLKSSDTQAESSAANTLTAYGMDGISVGADVSGGINVNTYPYANWFFRRAPGVFDVVCYTGTGSATTVAHGLGVMPEMMIIKRRDSTGEWPVYHSFYGAAYRGYLNQISYFETLNNVFNSTEPTASVFTVGTSGDTNTTAGKYVAYLFATKAGISKVGSYTGNGSNQNIECGFTSGARFVLIKRASGTVPTIDSWYVYDTARGINAGNDPHLSLDTTDAEVTTDDSIDPYSPGFNVVQVAATNINVNAATYIFLAFA